MIGTTVKFKNRPNDDGTLSNITIEDCLIAPSGGPATPRPQVTVHLPKKNDDNVEGAWFEYDGSTYHVIGQTAKTMAENTPTRWNRYIIAEKIY